MSCNDGAVIWLYFQSFIIIINRYLLCHKTTKRVRIQYMNNHETIFDEVYSIMLDLPSWFCKTIWSYISFQTFPFPDNRLALIKWERNHSVFGILLTSWILPFVKEISKWPIHKLLTINFTVYIICQIVYFIKYIIS